MLYIEVTRRLFGYASCVFVEFFFLLNGVKSTPVSSEVGVYTETALWNLGWRISRRQVHWRKKTKKDP